jgi:hypothetical protein
MLYQMLLLTFLRWLDAALTRFFDGLMFTDYQDDTPDILEKKLAIQGLLKW